jgi:hypothetical protein
MVANVSIRNLGIETDTIITRNDINLERNVGAVPNLCILKFSQTSKPLNPVG